MNIDELLSDLNKKRKTPKQLLQEIEESIHNKKYGIRGEDGLDADEDEIVERVLSVVLAQIPEPIKGEDGKDAKVDYNKIFDFIKNEISKLPKPQSGKNGVVDYSKVFKKIEEIKIPEVDYTRIATDAVNLLESFEGDERLDAKAIKNLEENIDANKLDLSKVSVNAKQVKGILDLLPKNPPQNAGGSGATFLKSMRDIPNAKTATDGQALVKRGKEFKFEDVITPETQDLQAVTDIGSTTTNPITAQSFITTDGDNTEVVLGDGTLKPLADIQTLPAGSDTQVQFNNSGVFGATPNLTWNNKLNVTGEEETLSGATTNLSGVASEGDITNSVAWNFQLKVTPYRSIFGSRFYYDSLTSSVINIPANTYTSVQISWTWDALVGADGYVVQKYTEFVGGGIFNTFTEGGEDVGNITSYSQDDLENLSGELPVGQTYNLTSIDSKGPINIQSGGSLNFGGQTTLYRNNQGGISLGQNNQQGVSFAFGSGNNIGINNRTGGLVFGFNNKIPAQFGLVAGSNNIGGDFNYKVFGDSNKLNASGVVMGNSNELNAVGVVMGDSNILAQNNSIIIGRFLAPVISSVVIGYGGGGSIPPNNMVIQQMNGRFGTSIDLPSRDIELNKDVIVENLNRRGAILFKNGDCMIASGGWTLGTGWANTPSNFKGFEKLTNGTGTLTPVYNPVQAGKRYALQISFLSPTGGGAFTGSATITIGGVSLGTVSNLGGKWWTFDSINTNNLVITPSNTSRFIVFTCFLFELTNGDTETVGSGFFGQKQYFIKQDGTSRVGDLTVDDAIRGPEKISNGNLTGYSTTSSRPETWTWSTGWTYNIAGEEARKSANGTGAFAQSIANMNTPFVIGGTYELIYTVSSRTVGTVTPSAGGVGLTARSANGTYTQQFTAVSNTQLAFTPTNTARFYLKNISCKRVNNPKIELRNAGVLQHELLNNGYAHFNKAQNTNGDLVVSSFDKTELFKVDAGTNIVSVDGTMNSTSYSVGGVAGASGSFTTVDLKTVTVVNGIITSII